MSPAVMKTAPKMEDTTPHGVAKSTKKTNQEHHRELKVKDLKHLYPHIEHQLLLANLYKEDPKLKEKLKHIVEATQKSMDEAYIALHDCDYDINRAVNKLLEEGNNEWRILSKKKKSPKPQEPRVEDESKKKEEAAEPAGANVTDNDQMDPKRVTGERFRTRGRAREMLQRRRGSSNSRQEQRVTGGSPMRRVFVNSKLEAMNRELIESGKLETVRVPVIRPVDTWDPKRPVSSLLTKGSKLDFEDEEYTGPLSKGLVITSSTFHRRMNFDEPQSTARSSDRSRSKSPISAEGNLPEHTIVNKTPDSSSNSETQNTHLETPTPESAPKLNLERRAPPMTASLVKAPPLSDKPSLCRPRSASVATSVKSSPSKIPEAPVEMPPDTDSSVELLDITFGAVDLEEHPFDNLAKSDSSTEYLLCTNKSAKAEETKMRNKGKPPVENLRFAKDLKIDAGLYDTSARQSSFSKVAQKPQLSRGYNVPTTSKEMSPPQSSVPYTAPCSQNSAFPQPAYQHTASSQSVPYYQAVLGAQTYTSSTHYGTSGLTSPSFSVPYQTYSSMLQGQKSSPAFDLEAIAAGFPVASAANFPPVTAESASKDSSSAKDVRQPMISPHQVILGQSGVTYFPPPLYFQEMQLLQQQAAGAVGGRGGGGGCSGHFYDFPAGSPPHHHSQAEQHAGYPGEHHPQQYLEPAGGGRGQTQPQPLPPAQYQLPPPPLFYTAGSAPPQTHQQRPYN